MSLSDYLSSPFLLSGIQNAGIPNSPNFSSDDQKQKLEVEFCRDFNCCGLRLDNLHQLLEHYEEFHLSPCHNNHHTYDRGDLELLFSKHSPIKKRITHTDLSFLENPLQIQTTQTPGTSASNESEDDSVEKPYRCDVEECDKAYKNANGLKYHRLHGHCTPDESESDANKPFVCSIGACRKRYKNLNGLKYHIEHTHSLKPALTSDMFIKPNHIEPHGQKRRLSCSSSSSESS